MTEEEIRARKIFLKQQLIAITNEEIEGLKSSGSCIYVRENLSDYFKIGVSDDFILIRADFPMAEISPGDFSKLIKEMFQRNDEVRSHGK